MPLPITLLGGFLGAGKTTLVNHLLTSLSGRRVAVLVNDFGDLSIDAELIEAVEDGVMSLKGGCMCCAIRDSAVSTVLQMAEREAPPEHVVIEASGSSDVAALKDTFRNLERHQTVRVDGLVTVVDAEQFDPRDPDVGLLVRCQVKAADLVVINKVDLVDEARRARVEAEIRGLAPMARVWSTTRAEVPSAILLGSADPTSDHDEILAPPAHTLFDSRVITLPRPVEGHRLVAALADLPRAVFRAKGFVVLAERPEDRVLMQVVGRRVHVRTLSGPAGPSRLVVIARAGAVDWEGLTADLQACAP